ncbi:hypothetical protein OAL15_02500, partial [Flavobacteriales bacterium]|nr:hypothetical protein [Flavobacteriales bacterium]
MYRLLRKHFTILALVALPGSVFSQATITGAEYFWDTDPGVGNATAMVSADGTFGDAIESALETALASPIAGGIHIFNVRCKDSDGDWGPVFKRTIATEDVPRDIKITLAEYLWDTDPGEGAATAMVAFDGAFNEAVETALQSALTAPAQGGLHLFNIRVKDENGDWGPVFKRTIAVEDTPRDIKITLAEFFWDTDPGEGSGTAMVAFDGAFNEVVETALQSALTAPTQGGLHLFNIRVKDENGDWGPVFKRTIATEAAPREIKITLAEFFWDTDPGEGSGTAMIAFDGAFDEALETVLSSAITTPSQGGLHLFNIRVRDDQNNWGPVFKRTIATEDTPRDIKVTLAEYFWNTDPGEGAGTAMVAFDGAFDEAIETALVTALTAPAQGGVNLFNVRLKDENGNWGPVFKRTVYTEDTPRDIKITAAEYFWGLTDPGEGNGTSMVAFDGAFDEAIESAFANGLNSPGIGLALYNVRVQDDNDDWGPLFKRTVYIEIPGDFLEVVALNPTDSICFGDSVQLVASGLVNYSWSPGASLSAETGDTVWAVPTATTTYIVTADDGSGNTEVDSITITVFNPIVDLGVDTLGLCLGDSILLDAGAGYNSYDWSAGDNTQTIYASVSGNYSVTVTGANSCTATDSVHIVELIPTLSTTDVTECEEYTWNGTVYTTSGTYTFLTTNAEGCDSTATLNLTINNSTVGPTQFLSDCGSATLNGETWTTSGVYTQVLTNAAGCDSTITVAVFINEETTSTTDVTECNEFTWNGTVYTTSGSYQFTTTNPSGCDSIATLNLTINNSTFGPTQFASGCGSATLNGETWTVTGVYNQVLTSSVGCDSTITVVVTIDEGTTSTTDVTECDEYTWNGTVYTTSGSYQFTTTNPSGCDSTATLNLTINNSTFGPTQSVSGCGSATLNGETWTATGVYTQVLTNAAGCDSTMTV